MLKILLKGVLALSVLLAICVVIMKAMAGLALLLGVDGLKVGGFLVLFLLASFYIGCFIEEEFS